MSKVNNQVLVFFVKQQEKKVLLGKKHAGAQIGPNTWNGPGGNVEKGETSRHAVVRETGEEFGPGFVVLEQDLIPRGEITFYHASGLVTRVELFVCFKFAGEPAATREMLEPTWFKFLQLASLDMMSGDQLFIPHILMGKSIQSGYVIFDDSYKVKSCNIVTC